MTEDQLTIQRLNDRNEALQREIQTLRRQNSNLQSKCAMQATDLNRTSNRLHTAREHIKRLEAELEEAMVYVP